MPIRSNIYKFSADRLFSAANGLPGQGSAITAIVQSPAIDVVGIASASGEISVYDLRTDERLMKMFMEGGSVRALGFRTGMFQ